MWRLLIGLTAYYKLSGTMESRGVFDRSWPSQKATKRRIVSEIGVPENMSAASGPASSLRTPKVAEYVQLS